MNELALLVAATLAAGTPLAIAGLGLLVNERAGVLNLGRRGHAAHLGGGRASPRPTTAAASGWRFAAGAAAGAAVAAVFGWLVVWLNTNQYATGLAVSLFGSGFSAFVGIDYVGKQLGEQPAHRVPLLRDLPFLGPALFRQHPMVYLAVALVGRGRPLPVPDARRAGAARRSASRRSPRTRSATACAGSGSRRW